MYLHHISWLQLQIFLSTMPYGGAVRQENTSSQTNVGKRWKPTKEKHGRMDAWIARRMDTQMDGLVKWHGLMMYVSSLSYLFGTISTATSSRCIVNHSQTYAARKQCLFTWIASLHLLWLGSLQKQKHGWVTDCGSSLHRNLQFYLDRGTTWVLQSHHDWKLLSWFHKLCLSTVLPEVQLQTWISVCFQTFHSRSGWLTEATRETKQYARWTETTLTVLLRILTNRNINSKN